MKLVGKLWLRPVNYEKGGRFRPPSRSGRAACRDVSSFEVRGKGSSPGHCNIHYPREGIWVKLEDT